VLERLRESVVYSLQKEDYISLNPDRRTIWSLRNLIWLDLQTNTPSASRCPTHRFCRNSLTSGRRRSCTVSLVSLPLESNALSLLALTFASRVSTASVNRHQREIAFIAVKKNKCSFQLQKYRAKTRWDRVID